MKRTFMLFCVLSFFPALAAAQTAASETKADTLKSKSPASLLRAAKPDSAAVQETELEAIAIEAVIEKPNVDIIPKRIEPELEEVEFVERSFDRELKEVPKDLLLLDDDLDRAAKLDGIKKHLENKKKKAEK
jgi:hypothetical protein